MLIPIEKKNSCRKVNVSRQSYSRLKIRNWWWRGGSLWGKLLTGHNRPMRLLKRKAWILTRIPVKIRTSISGRCRKMSTGKKIKTLCKTLRCGWIRSKPTRVFSWQRRHLTATRKRDDTFDHILNPKNVDRSRRSELSLEIISIVYWSDSWLMSCTTIPLFIKHCWSSINYINSYGRVWF